MILLMMIPVFRIWPYMTHQRSHASKNNVGCENLFWARPPPSSVGVRLQVIDNCSGNELIPFIKANIVSGSTVVTDGWKGYSSLEKKSYVHEQIFQVKAENKESVLPGVHMVASLIKRVFLGTYHGRLEKNHLQRYLDEYTFRFNRRNTKYVGKRF